MQTKGGTLHAISMCVRDEHLTPSVAADMHNNLRESIDKYAESLNRNSDRFESGLRARLSNRAGRRMKNLEQSRNDLEEFNSLLK
jgi:hypothetical protein